MSFSAPRTGGDQLKPSSIVGHLLLVRPTEYRKDVQTREFGLADAIQSDVVDFNATDEKNQPLPAPVIYRDVLWFNKFLLGLKGQVGEMVLGWMTLGTAKGSQDPPLMLEDATADTAAVAYAQSWLSANPAFEGKPAVSAPAAEASPPPAAQRAPLPNAAPAPVVKADSTTANPLDLLDEEQKQALRNLGVKI